MPGSLFVVATPIGNLEDLTFRALRTLREVDLIAAEDTRRTSKLLAHYGVRTSLVSLREHNEARMSADLTLRMQGGLRVALVSDAGTPGIADPGAKLVAAARAHGIPVVPIPGPSAVTTAASVSGFPTEGFVFRGFPPSAGQARKEWFMDLVNEPAMVVIFEAPHRIRRTLGELDEVLAERPIVVVREATKVHESIVISPIKTDVKEIGEFVIVIAPQPDRPSVESSTETIVNLIGRMTDLASLTDDEAFVAAAALTNSKPAAVRRLIKKARILAKRKGDPSA